MERFELSILINRPALVLSLLGGTIKRQHEGDLRRLKELIEARA